MIQRIAQRLPFYYGWLIVAVVFVTMAFGVNARTAFSLLFPPILTEFQWDRGATAGAFSFGFMVSAVITPILGRIMDKSGPLLVMEAGVLMAAAGMLLAPLATEPWHLYLTLGVLVGAGSVCTGYTGQSLFLPNWFARRRGLAVSIAFAGVGVGSILLLLRMRWALHAFALSLLGAAGSALHTAITPGASAAMGGLVFPLIICAIVVALMWFSWAMTKRGILR